MRYLFNNLTAIIKQMSEHKTCLLLLDFDGTLSSIVASPAKAKINRSAKAILQKLIIHKNIKTAIISGRSLKDIKNKVGIKNLIYAGNHGLEWQIGYKKFKTEIPKAYKKIAYSITKKFQLLSKQYKGVFLEYKGRNIAIHYRLLNKKFHREFLSRVVLILKPYKKNKALKETKGKKVIDIGPLTKWNKGSFSLYLTDLLRKGKVKPIVIYIGDDITDEDAFKALNKAITVRVGKRKNSAAKYYIKSYRETPAVLAGITHHLQEWSKK